jgi:hypothetical protein
MKVLLHSIILQLLCVCTLTSTQHVVLPVCTPSQPDIISMVHFAVARVHRRQTYQQY